MVFDRDRNLIVLQGAIGGSFLRKVSPEGLVTSFPVNFKQISYMESIAINKKNQMYVVGDSASNLMRSGNEYIEKVDESGKGQLMPLSETWPNKLSGLAVDSSGNIYRLDVSKNQIIKIAPNGAYSIFAGSGIKGFKDGNASNSQFNWPIDIWIDQYDNLYVFENGNHAIRKIDQDGEVKTYMQVSKEIDLHDCEIGLNGRIYVSSFKNGANVFLLDPQGMPHLIVNVPVRFSRIAIDEKGTIYAAMMESGLHQSSGILKIVPHLDPN